MDLPKPPKNERIWETLLLDGRYYIITSNNIRSKYYLYELVDNKWKKKSTGNSPVEAQKKMD